VHTLEIYRGLSRSRLRHVAPRHEQGAAFMADGWARVRGEPGVCTLIGGPGLTNAITPIAQAYHDSIPMLVISGAVPDRDRDLGEIHDLPDQQALMSTVTASSHTVRDPTERPGVFAAAAEVFESRRPRPVHLGVPLDVLAQPAPRERGLRAA
jgi:acetolactate synthase-1/2/3 large subunit